MAFKTFLSNRELGLNTHGVQEQPIHKGNITATAPGSGVYVVNCGGWIKATMKQRGWRVVCDRLGTHGTYDITVGNTVHQSLLDLEALPRKTTPQMIHAPHDGSAGPKDEWCLRRL